MKILSALMAKLGYVRLKDYGYALTPSGHIVEVKTVDDDRFAPPPWQPVAWQTPASLLPPAPSKPPVPRPLAPPPDPVEVEEAEPQPLFAAPASVETPAPGDHDYGIEIDEEPPEEEEWEWKMALARARETADKEKKDKDKKATPARPAPSSSFKTSSLPLTAPPPRGRVVDSPRPMSKIARPEPRNSIGKPAARVEARIHRVEPRSATEPPLAAARTPRTAPPKAPPRSSRMTAQRPAEPPPPPEPKSPARATLEKSVSRVFSPPTPTPSGKLRPLPRMARGTEAPDASRPTRPQLAQGSTRLPVVRDPSHDVTATDITAVDRAQVSMRDEEDTRVNLVVAPPSPDITLDIALDPEEKTTVDPNPTGVPVVSVSEGSPLPRLTARLRRVSSPN